VEVLLASAILAIVVAALLQAVVAGQVQAAEAVHDSRATMLAEMLMEEVLARPAADPEGDTPATGDDRTTYDSIDDFANYRQAAGALTDLACEPLSSGYQVFGWSVAIASSSQIVPSLGTRDGLIVSVTVTDARSREWTVQRWVPQTYRQED
jgi:Tfp pilus assembly protein PilV